MFTGLITDVGEIVDRQDRGDVRFVIRSGYDLSTVSLGASIACSGVCLTAISLDDDCFSVDVSRETLSVTTLKNWQPGSLVNLERSLKLGDEMGGHIVTGHVDTVGIINLFEEVGDSWRMRVLVDGQYGAFIARKGSVAINGVSLTVNAIEDEGPHTVFDVNIIPHTYDVTAFRQTKKGDLANIEVDLMARYLARYTEKRPDAATAGR